MSSDLRERLRQLERTGKLEKLLAPQGGGLPWHELVWALQFPAMLGAGILVVRLANQAKGGGQPPAADLIWLGTMLVIALALRFGGPLARTPAQRRRDLARRRGALLPTALVMANDQHFAGDNDEWLPGAVVLSFDPAAQREPERLLAAARRLFALKSADRRTLPAEQLPLAWDLYHEMVPTPPRAVPAALSEGLADCVLASVVLPPQPLRDGELLLALVGAPDAVEMLPAAVARADQLS